MLPLLLIAIGAGAIALYMASDHGKATADANLAHRVTDAHLAEAAQASQQADQHAAQQQVAQEAGARQEAAAQEAAARQKAAAHAAAAQTATAVAAQKTAEAALAAKTDRERTITSLQADLTEANKDKTVAMQMMQQAAAALSPKPGSGPLDIVQKAKVAAQQQVLKKAMDSFQAAYDRAQARASAAEAGLRQIGVNPRDIPKAPAPPRGDIAR